ncbi:GIN domain-containing protein [Phenylobacterium sp.]|uniref:GIN domain-containing protein n=1 Tax=Phenylobacterium sp. TaxID=1871053 RepID=UPI00286CFD76|nr:DUF2807 domain-containing protein [Phenylobacterium sp.]
MIRVLVLIAVTGFFVGVVALSSAAAIGGPDLAAHNWHWINKWSDSTWREHAKHDAEFDFDIDVDGPGGVTVTRELVWNGGTELDIEIVAEVAFTQAEGPGKVVITGPKSLVDRVTLVNGRLDMNGPNFAGRRLKVTVTAPGVTAFDVDGDSTLTIEGFKQDSLTVDASGDSEVTARGVARLVRLDISGSAQADLSGVQADETTVDSSGASESTVAPKAVGRFDISGSSEVTLNTKPAQIETDISGRGELHQPGR